MAAGYVDRIGKGEIPVKNLDEYKGDFNQSITGNQFLIDGLGSLTEGYESLGRMSRNELLKKVMGEYGLYDDEISRFRQYGCRTASTRSAAS